GKLKKDSLEQTVAWLYKNYLRPVYLIFDQLEELFILGTAEEQNQFIETIAQLIEAELPCKILLIMREEYLAQLYGFEKKLPSLMDRRLRVEPMSYAKVGEVIAGSCESFNISLQEPDKNIEQIIGYVSGGKSGIQLPYLQVYLDRLWREDFQRTFPKGWEREKDSYPELEFTEAEIEELGEIEQVMESFLRDQSLSIIQATQQAFPALSTKAVPEVLDFFVTEEGTKQPIPYQREEEQVLLAERFMSRVAEYPTGALTFILEELEKARVLRFTAHSIELAHDSLADLIDKERSGEQRQLNQIRKRVGAAYAEHLASGVFLTQRQLASLEGYLSRLELDEKTLGFIEASEEEIHRLAQEEKERQEKELRLVEEKLATEQRARKRQRIFTMLIALALVAATAGGVFAFRQWKISQDQQEQLKAQSDELQKAKEEAEDQLKAFLTSEAQRVSLRVDDLLGRANDLESSYPQTSQTMRQQAKEELEKYPDNPELQEKLVEVEALLK
ncbi:MAG: hypothetical protein AAFP92_32315, partial [Bacteroidota bacterium]